MMTLEQYKEQYKGMSAAEVRGLIARSAEFRTETEKLYRSIYRRPLNKSCGDCWIDAYILIMKGNPEKLKAMQEKRYDLRAGAVLVDPKDPTKTATTHNITDELAIHHLRIHPTCKRLFSVLPENWEEEVNGKQEDNSDLEGLSADELAVFEGFNREQRDRIREIITEAKTPEDALASCSVLETEGFNSAAEKIRDIAQKELAERELARQAEANEKAAAEFKEAVEAIGEVTVDDDCKARIYKANGLYEAMNDEQKELVVEACAVLGEHISAYDVAKREKDAREAAKKEKAAAEAAANAGAPADGSNADAPADAPAEEEKAAEGKENKKNNTKK